MITHRQCQAEVKLVDRVVISAPEDKNWPRDNRVRVPYCLACRRVVSIDELDEVKQEG